MWIYTYIYAFHLIINIHEYEAKQVQSQYNFAKKVCWSPELKYMSKELWKNFFLGKYNNW